MPLKHPQAYLINVHVSRKTPKKKYHLVIISSFHLLLILSFINIYKLVSKNLKKTREYVLYKNRRCKKLLYLQTKSNQQFSFTIQLITLFLLPDCFHYYFCEGIGFLYTSTVVGLWQTIMFKSFHIHFSVFWFFLPNPNTNSIIFTTFFIKNEKRTKIMKHFLWSTPEYTKYCQANLYHLQNLIFRELFLFVQIWLAIIHWYPGTHTNIQKL